MLVAHASDHITHAVIGGKKAVNFGISDDPAFFQILSSALYKNPTLAMVRETICNAWDAHIEAGITDIPIEISLTDEYLIIKDFATGIHDDLIAPIYGIYGASTKKKDARQTGGFGLGCKSPFAYSDHFEVTSAHNGTKTIYNMSKSSGEVEGKPSITPIASFPCTDSGITVKIPINPNKNDMGIDGYIRNVVFNGDISAEFNGELLPILGLGETEFGLVLVHDKDNIHSRHIKNTVNIRYGNVIYPVEPNEQTKALYDKVHNLLDTHYHCKLIMLAPANSISVTPSRESLTNSDITIETLNTLMGKFLSVFLKNQQLLFRHGELVNEYVDLAAEKEAPLVEKLPAGNWVIPGMPSTYGENLLKTSEDFAKLEVVLRYSSNAGLKPKKFLQYIQRYLYKVNEANLFDRGLLQSWARTFQKNLQALRDPREWGYDSDRYEFSPQGYRLRQQPVQRKRAHTSERKVATIWWQKRVLLPLIEKLKAVPNFDKRSLYYVSKNHKNTDRYGNPAPVQVSRTPIFSHTHNTIHFLIPTVILCHGAEQLPRRIMNIAHPNSVGTMQRRVYFIYEIGRKQSEIEAVQEALNNIPGIEYMDYTGRTASEESDYLDRQAKITANRAAISAGKPPLIRVPKKQRAGMPQLSIIVDGNNLDTYRFTTDKDPVRVVNPKAVALISTGENKRRHIDGIYEIYAYNVAKLFGDVTGISNKSDAIARAKEKDPTIVDIREYVYDQIIDAVQTSPTLIEYQKSDIEKIKNYIEEKAKWDRQHSLKKLAELIIDYPSLHNIAPAIQPLSDEDQMRWYLWKNLEQIRYGKRDDIHAIRKTIADVQLKPEIVEFLDKLIANRFLDLIDADVARELLRDTKDDPIEAQKVVDLITNVIN